MRKRLNALTKSSPLNVKIAWDWLLAAASTTSSSAGLRNCGRHGIEELRVWDDAGTFRVVYKARLADAVCVVHAFQKKTQATPKRDIEIAKARFIQLTRADR